MRASAEHTAQKYTHCMPPLVIQEERKVLEPYLMSKAERQMNSALLRKLGD